MKRVSRLDIIPTATAAEYFMTLETLDHIDVFGEGGEEVKVFLQSESCPYLWHTRPDCYSLYGSGSACYGSSFMVLPEFELPAWKRPCKSCKSLEDYYPGIVRPTVTKDDLMRAVIPSSLRLQLREGVQYEDTDKRFRHSFPCACDTAKANFKLTFGHTPLPPCPLCFPFD